jgi:hypothetical protein
MCKAKKQVEEDTSLRSVRQIIKKRSVILSDSEESSVMYKAKKQVEKDTALRSV